MIDYSRYQKGPNESIVDYYLRLASTRSGGILGTGGLMDKATETPAVEETATGATEGSAQYSCPAGYTWNGTACVKDSGNSGDSGVPQDLRTPEQKLSDAIKVQSDRQVSAGEIFGLFGAIPGLVVGGLENWQNNSQIRDAMKDAGMSDEEIKLAMTNPENAVMQAYRGDYGSGVQESMGGSVMRPNTSAGGSIIGSLFDSFFPTTPDMNPTTGVPYAPMVTANPLATQGLMGTIITGTGDSGTTSGNQYYVQSDGTLRDVSNLSDNTQAGLLVNASGAFDTPSWYEDDYSEPSSSSGSGSSSGSTGSTGSSGSSVGSGSGWSAGKDADYGY